MPTRVVISGATGRMGQALVALIGADSDLTTTGGLDQHEHSAADAQKFGFPAIAPVEKAGALLENADIVIDFSAPAGLRTLL